MFGEISIQKAQWALANKSGIKLIDVRTVGEYRQGHIAGSVNIPLANIRDCCITDKSTPIFVYCKGGGRAHQAKDTLMAMGYTNVTNIGGISGWKLIND